MPLEIMPAAVSDAAAILALQRLAYQSEAEIYQDWTIPPLTETLADLEHEFGRQIILKAVEGETIAGSVRACQTGNTCAIGRLIVHPELQGRGIGSRLMQRIETYFPQAKRFELFTGSRSERNIRLYEKLGYRIYSESSLTAKVGLVGMEKIIT